MSNTGIKRLARGPQAAVGLGAIGVLAAAFGGDSQRFFANCTLWLIVLVSVILGAFFLVALEHLVNARWSVPVRRVPERLTTLLVPALVLFIIAAFGLRDVYLWAAHPQHLVGAKAIWLDLRFFIIRTAVYFAIWALFFRLLVTPSLAQDRGRRGFSGAAAKARSAVFMILFAFTTTLFSFDWLMSVEPQWYSTILGVYFFAGSVSAGIAAAVLLLVFMQSQGRLSQVRGDHRYNLGALLFAFNTFWVSMGYCQFMLIWYGNLPEETIFYYHRFTGAWGAVSVLLPVVHFLVPFLALLPRDAKSDPRRLVMVALFILVGRVIDIYWFVFPGLERGVLIGWQEAAFALLVVGLVLLWLQRALRWGADMPEGDPLLAEGLAFRL